MQRRGARAIAARLTSKNAHGHANAQARRIRAPDMALREGRTPSPPERSEAAPGSQAETGAQPQAPAS